MAEVLFPIDAKEVGDADNESDDGNSEYNIDWQESSFNVLKIWKEKIYNSPFALYYTFEINPCCTET